MVATVVTVVVTVVVVVVARCNMTINYILGSDNPLPVYVVILSGQTVG